MIQYILECIAFQLVFLIIYDFFLKRETFFQWNRLYLLGTHILSLLLPWIKIEALKTTVPAEYYVYPEFLWNMQTHSIELSASETSSINISWQEGVFILGVLAASALFAYKMRQLYRLRIKGEILSFTEFTQIIVANSNLAFSFFKSIFLGDNVVQDEHENIIKHELVHIRQKHSYDLLFFELMRIVCWFNPLVYVYQNRISELHEFIADAQVAKTNKKEQYQLLLSQVFQTQHISFINQFFKSSLIKKRIVMLQRSRSKKVFKWKYVLLLPVILGMLLYTSCNLDESKGGEGDIETIMVVNDIDKMSKAEEEKLFLTLKNYSDKGGDWQYLLKDKTSSIFYESSSNDSYIKFDNYEDKIYATMIIQGSSMAKGTVIGTDKNGIMVPFGQIDEVPIFPGCENETDPRACFQQMMQKHISKNFRYPEKAQEMGIQGRVNTMFVIAEDGSIQNVRMRGPDTLLEKEVARIIQRLPRMQPGKQDGKTVRVPFSIPVTFKLEQSDFGDFYNKKAVQESEDLTNRLFNEAYSDIVPFSKVDEAPTFPDCRDETDKRTCFQKSIQKHIRKNFRYPKEAQEKGIQGRVAVLFIIAKDGSIKGLKTRGPDKSLEAEAERIVLRLPQMIPGRHNGKLTDVTFSIPITFKLK